MGMYVRTGIKAGPFRFTMSRSGVTVSAGVPGFRVGSGPRGNYVRVGRGGVTYRTTTMPRVVGPTPPRRWSTTPSEIVMEDRTGGSVLDLDPSTGDEITQQLNTAARRRGLGWPAVVAVLVLSSLLGERWWIGWVVGAPLCWWLFLRDASRRTVVLFYDVTDAAADWFAQVVDSWEWMTGSQKIWRTVEAGDVRTTHQHKTNAGAGTLVSRVAVTAGLSAPPHLSTNVAVPSLTAGRSGVHFLPDRMIVREGRSYVAIPYTDLHVSAHEQRFIERSGTVPRDAHQVGTTWKYVNVRGGPDRRFKDNTRLPIMQYGALDLQTRQGATWFVQTSRTTAAAEVARVLRRHPVPPL